jgi:formate hydrogenlyase transcriptional activator
VLKGTFRQDLFYRLNVFPIEAPSLRDRKEDIPLLTDYFINRFARKLNKKVLGISKKTCELLQAYSWPGNIRELQNVVERSIIVCETDTLTVDESWLTHEPSQKLAASERITIEAALAEARGRVSGPSGAAAKLGMPASTLESKIRALKINKHLFKTG